MASSGAQSQAEVLLPARAQRATGTPGTMEHATARREPGAQFATAARAEAKRQAILSAASGTKHLVGLQSEACPKDDVLHGQLEMVQVPRPTAATACQDLKPPEDTSVAFQDMEPISGRDEGIRPFNGSQHYQPGQTYKLISSMKQQLRSRDAVVCHPLLSVWARHQAMDPSAAQAANSELTSISLREDGTAEPAATQNEGATVGSDTLLVKGASSSLPVAAAPSDFHSSEGEANIALISKAAAKGPAASLTAICHGSAASKSTAASRNRMSSTARCRRRSCDFTPNDGASQPPPSTASSTAGSSSFVSASATSRASGKAVAAARPCGRTTEAVASPRQQQMIGASVLRNFSRPGYAGSATTAPQRSGSQRPGVWKQQQSQSTTEAWGIRAEEDETIARAKQSELQTRRKTAVRER